MEFCLTMVHGFDQKVIEGGLFDEKSYARDCKRAQLQDQLFELSQVSTRTDFEWEY